MGVETKEWLATSGLAADAKCPIAGLGDSEGHDHKQDGQVEKCVSAAWPRDNGRVSCDRFAGGERDEGPQFRTEAALQVRLTGDKLQPVGKVESNQYAEAIRSV